MKRKKELLLFKVDFEKPYDYVNWTPQKKKPSPPKKNLEVIEVD